MKSPTLKLLKDRCQEVGDMWLWDQMKNAHGVPIVHVNGRHESAYRVAYCLHHSLDLADLAGLVVWPKTEPGDINPAHLKAGTRAQLVAWQTKQGKFKKSPAALANITAGSRARKTNKTTPEMIALIRSSEEPATKLAPKLGLARSTVSKIRAGTLWSTVNPSASIFTMGAA